MGYGQMLWFLRGALTLRQSPGRRRYFDQTAKSEAKSPELAIDPSVQTRPNLKTIPLGSPNAG
jgi:hypothetical protein